MVTEVESLLIRIETTQRQFERQMVSMTKRSSEMTSRYERNFKESNKRVAASFTGVRTAANAVFGALGARQVLTYADAWTEASNKIAAASEISGKQARELTLIGDIADETRSGFTQTVDLYAKILRASKDVAESEAEVATATLIVNKAFIAGGAAATEQAAGVLQLGQALNSAFLQGDELRSIRENAPLLAQAIADEFDTTIGGLKKLGAEGELTSDRVFKAILAAETNIEAAFQRTNSTIGQGFTRLRNALIEYVATADSNIEATEKLVKAFTFLADNLDLVAAGAVFLGIRGITPLAVAMASKLAPAAAVAATSLQLITVRGGAATVAVSALRGAMALLGGPIGIALTAAVGAAYAFASMKDSSESLSDAVGNLSNDFSEIVDISSGLENEYRDLERANRDLAKAQRDGGQAAVEAATLDVNAINSRIEKNKELLQGVIILKQQQLNEARAALAVSDEARLADQLRKQTAIENIQVQAQAAAQNREISREDRRAAFERIDQLGLVGETIEETNRRYTEALTTITQGGGILSNDQKEWIAEGVAIEEARQKIELMEVNLIALADAGNVGAIAIENLIPPLNNLSATAIAAAEGIATLVSLIPQLNSASATVGKLVEANSAYQDAIRGATTPDDYNSAVELYAQATAEINGTADAARDAADAFDEYTDRSRLDSMDAQARAIELETRRFSELEAQLVQTGAAETDLADLQAAHAANLAGITESFADKPSRGGGGGSSSTLTAADTENDTLSRLKLEIELIGKTRGEVAALTYEYDKLRDAKKKGVDLDKIAVETGLSLRDTISKEAEAIADLTLKAEQYSAQAEFIQSATEQLQDGFIDAILEGENFGDTLADLGKQLAKAALQAALFGKGPLAALFGTSPGGGGGSLLGGLFGFAAGGYTGVGAKFQPAGIVHRGEYVLDAETTKKIGVNNLDQLRSNLRKGYASGGFVNNIPSVNVGSPSVSPTINVPEPRVDIRFIDTRREDVLAVMASAEGQRQQQQNAARAR